MYSTTNLPDAGTVESCFRERQILNDGATIICGSFCYFGNGYIISQIYREDYSGHDGTGPHLNVNVKFERVLSNGSEFIVKVNEKLSEQATRSLGAFHLIEF